jgi:hypothetical protein
VIGNNADLGFFLHPSLVVEAQSSRCIGYSNVITWSREAEAADKAQRNYPPQPIEEKESYRWLQAAQASQQLLGLAGQLTIIADREGDINELFERVPDEKTHLLIRSCHDRRLAETAQKLYACLAQQLPGGRFTLSLKGDARTKRKKRVATIVLRWMQVALAPVALKGQVLQVYALEAREENPPQGEKPILWRLLTTHSIVTEEQARQAVAWYAERWNIEQVFRLIKHQGLNVEMLDLESGKSLIQPPGGPVTLLALLTVSKILILHLASKQQQPLELAQTFTVEEVTCLQALHQKYEGNTPKQKNPYPPHSLQWVYWIMARLGGWKPHEKQAGVISLMRGLRRFHQIFHGWILAKQIVS